MVDFSKYVRGVGMTTSKPSVTLELTRLQFTALLSLVTERCLDEDGTNNWVDVLTDETVTIQDLLSLLSAMI